MGKMYFVVEVITLDAYKTRQEAVTAADNLNEIHQGQGGVYRVEELDE
jgi:hypothetical protein